MSQRDSFLRFVDECLRADVPYLWGGKSLQALDCSGLVTLGLYLASGLDLRQTHNTDMMWNHWEPISGVQTRPGDVALYGGSRPDDVSHVMVLLDGGSVIGASGGDSTSTSLRIAASQGAQVRRYSRADYRSDLRGFRRLPLPLDDA